MENKIDIRNKKAYHKYEIIDTYKAGIELLGTEIKSIRNGKASLTDAYCRFVNNQLWIEMRIAEYSHGGHYNHDPNRIRRLLLNRKELDKLQRKVTTTGYTIVPLKLFIDQKGWAKLIIGLAKGRKIHDHREAIKQKDAKREMARQRKQNNRIG